MSRLLYAAKRVTGKDSLSNLVPRTSEAPPPAERKGKVIPSSSSTPQGPSSTPKQKGKRLAQPPRLRINVEDSDEEDPQADLPSERVAPTPPSRRREVEGSSRAVPSQGLRVPCAIKCPGLGRRSISTRTLRLNFVFARCSYGNPRRIRWTPSPLRTSYITSSPRWFGTPSSRWPSTSTLTLLSKPCARPEMR